MHFSYRVTQFVFFFFLFFPFLARRFLVLSAYLRTCSSCYSPNKNPTLLICIIDIDFKFKKKKKKKGKKKKKIYKKTTLTQQFISFFALFFSLLPLQSDEGKFLRVLPSTSIRHMLRA